MKRRTFIALIAAMILPLLTSLMAVGAVAGRTDRIDHVPAAVVSLDEGTTMEVDGKEQQVPLGRLIAADLVSPVDESVRDTFEWKLVDADAAREGLADGTYYAVVTIPAEFSRNLATMGSPKATPAVINVESNQATSEVLGRVSSSIARAVANHVGEGMTEKLLEGIYLGFGQLGDGLDEAAEGADKLADGTGQAADGARQSADGSRELADNMPALAAGARQIAGGAGALAAGSARAASGVGQLASGAHELAAGQRTYAAGVDRYAAGQDQLAAGARQLADGTAQIRAELDKLPPEVRALLSGETDLSELDKVLATLEPLPGQLDDLIDPVAAEAAIREAIARLEAARPTLERIASQARQSAQRMREAAAIMADFSAGGLAGDVAALRDGLLGQIDGALGDSVAQCSASGASEEFCAQLAAQVSALRASTASPEVQALMERLTAFAQQLDPAHSNLLALLNGDGTPNNPGLITLLDSLATTLTGPDGASGAIGELIDATTGLQRLIKELGGADGVIATLTQLRELLVGNEARPGLITMLRTALPQLPEFYHGMLALADGTSQLADGTAASAPGPPQHSTGAPPLAQGTGQLAGGASSAADGLRQLATGAGALDAGAGQLADGAGQAADGSAQLADGLSQLADGMGELSTGTISLADGLHQAADEVPRYTDEEQARMVAMGGAPVTVTDSRLHADTSPAAAWFPPIAPLMLFLGAIATYLILPAVPRGARSGAVSTYRAALRGWWPAAAIGALQGALLAILMPVLGVGAAHPFLAGGALIVMGVAFAAVVQALHILAGARLGTVIALAALVLQAVALSVVLPSATAPAAIQALHGVLPVGAGADALSAAVLPGLGSLAVPLAIVIGWGAAALVATVVSMGRRQTFTTDELRAAVA